MHTLFLHWTETCGDAYTIKLETQVLVLCDPKDVKAVLDMRPGTFERAMQICEPVIKSGFNGVFSMNGDTWKRHRRLTSSAFSRPNIKNAVPKINFVARILVGKWAQRTEGGKARLQQLSLQLADKSSHSNCVLYAWCAWPAAYDCKEDCSFYALDAGFLVSVTALYMRQTTVSCTAMLLLCITLHCALALSDRAIGKG
eukprot:8405-Heterococcus_DN1.PRE.1